MDVSYAHFLIGLRKHFLLWYLFLLYFLRHLRSEYLSSDESNESDKEESKFFWSESGLAGTLGTRLGGLLRDVCLPLCVTHSAYETCDGNGGSLAVPEVKNISGAIKWKGACTKCTSNVWVLILVGNARAVVSFCFSLHYNIFFIAQIMTESFIDRMFVKSSVMSWFESSWFVSTLIESEFLWFQIT